VEITSARHGFRQTYVNSNVDWQWKVRA